MENKKLSRAQVRYIERTEKEATEKHAMLSEQFLNAFMALDPEGEEIKKFYKALSAKWRAYCKIKKFGEKAYTALDDSMNKVIEEFNSAKAIV